jgi:hypothetical protein
MAKVTQHEFTAQIVQILEHQFAENALEILETSPLLGYLNIKTKSANRDSKARGAFANLYALYVMIEDYLAKGFDAANTEYAKYEGARFSDLLKRQRELPFGTKLQNHALNSRLNKEFKKYYSSLEITPIIRDLASQRYWIQEDLLYLQTRDGQQHQLATAILEIIDAYVITKKAAFEAFLKTCQQIAELGQQQPEQAIEFIRQQLQPTVDARVFEIISFAVLKLKYVQENIWIGKTKESVLPETLMLFKTGRTNANDGGIDFVMRPLGRFFQVTETTDVQKYFLDIDKVQRFPITFVIKSSKPPLQMLEEIRVQAIAKYKIEVVVNSYMQAIEEILTIPNLLEAFDFVVQSGQLQQVMDEIVVQSKLEFNILDDVQTDIEDLE